MNEIDDAEDAALATLGPLFLQALAHREAGDVDKAEDLLRDVIRREPRVGEPHLELARVLLDTDRVAEAEEHAREALSHLTTTGVWIEDVPENTVLALAHAVLAECLRRRADEDDLIFGDPDDFNAVIREAQAHFQAAHELDPSDEYASYHAFFMGLPTPGAPGEGADDVVGDPLLPPDPT